MHQHPIAQPDASEPLSLSAALARQWACESCVVDGHGHRCDGYHGLWQTLRLVGLGATLGGHADAYVQAMRDIASEWRLTTAPVPRRLLISGCADYSMLAHVLYAFAQGETPHITVLDICPTPVRLNDWYARRVGRTIDLVCADLLQHQPDAPYDLVVTSSLLGFFSPEDRSRLFAAYARMMHPGASLVFSNRLRPEPESEPVGFKQHDAEKFADKVAELAAALPGTSKLDRAEARRMALAYATLRRPYPVNSVETVRQLAASAGLQLTRAGTVRSAMAPGAISGPTMGDGSEYLFVVIRKPDRTAPSGTAAAPVD